MTGRPRFLSLVASSNPGLPEGADLFNDSLPEFEVLPVVDDDDDQVLDLV